MLLDPSDENGRSCGSFFVNPIVSELEARAISSTAPPDMPRYVQADGRVKLSAAWLIERAGLHRGLRQGSVGLSTRHCLALVTHPGATTEGLLQLAQAVRERVHDCFGIWLTPEPVLWGSGIEAALSGESTTPAASRRGPAR
jgi:UDP-N-acetylmuramate dehydrogenase